ncbi:MAG: TolC family protein [Candidatus Eremiobacteraeota bacterium]|nr:TolC family protein [Candidatus Eremiobacteraeota bacterium]MCW5866671.1 TolC family protein [Candidatus Eremiobacteraeota bacterium]
MKELVLFLTLALSPLATAQQPTPTYNVDEEEPSGLSLPEDLLPSPGVDPLQLAPDSQGVIKLDVQQAVERGLSSHPQVLAANARVRSAYWAFQKAASLPSTQITVATIPGTNVAGSQPGGNNPAGAGAGFATFAANGLTDTYIQVTQPFLPMGSYTTAQKVAVQDYRVAVADWKTSRVKLRQQIKDAFYSLLAAQEAMRVVQNNRDLANEGYTIAQKRFSSGAGPQLDLIDSGVQLSRANQDLVRSQAGLKQAQATLAPLLNLPGHTLIECAGSLDTPSLELAYTKLLELAQNNPQIQSALYSLERSRRSVTLAEQQANPTPMLTFLRDLATRTYQFQIGLQFPIDWGQIRNDVRAKEESVLEQEQNLRATRLEVSSNLKVAFEQYLGAVQNAADFREKVLQPSEESTRITQYGFKRGAVPYTRLLTSQQNLAAVRKEYISLLQSVFVALDALEAAAGQPVLTR